MRKILAISFIIVGLFFVLSIQAQDNTSNIENPKVEEVKLGERIDKWFGDNVVSPLEEWLFFDPFSYFGIYDPVLYDDQGNPVLDKNGNPMKTQIYFVVAWLIVGSVFFTFRMKFINIRGFKHAFELIKGKYDNPDDKGEVSHFQALTTALSGTVGLGNIAGVAAAIAVGGPGATFWMILAGLIGMSAKFVECTLGVKYRNINEKGSVSGGPMYYLSKGFANRKMAGLGKVLAILFAIMCVGGSFGGGNMFQANQAFAQVSVKFPTLASFSLFGILDGSVLFGLVLAVLVGVVIIGGLSSIAKVTDKIVPFMVGMYVLLSLTVIGMNFVNIGEAMQLIVEGAFASDAMRGGFIGVLMVGFKRAAFSNEAGIGSASIAHSASKTNEPVSEGIVSLLEPFIDTVIVCTMTAFVLIFTGYGLDTQGLDGSALTSAAFESQIPGSSWILLVAILLFAFSTMISWSYYGLKCWSYVFGETKTMEIIYKAVFLICIVVGASSSMGSVLGFSDLMVLCMAFPNILGLYVMSGEVSRDLKSYLDRVKSGEIKRYK